MYARHVGDKTLRFAVSGKLWDRSLVMIDKETKTLWSHLLGEAMEGELKGTKLKMIPSTMTDWATWEKLHPATSVVSLRRTSRNYQREFYRDPSQFVLGIADRGTPKAWGFEELKKRPVLNDAVANTAVLILFDAASKTGLAFDRRLQDKTLTFKDEGGNLVDEETGSHWDRLTGKAVEGTLKGQLLTPLPAIVSYVTAWVTFHPDTTGLSPELMAKAKAAVQRQSRVRAGNIADRIMSHDKNKDGKVSPDEMPEGMRPILDRADSNKDGAIDRAEAKALARQMNRGRRPGKKRK